MKILTVDNLNTVRNGISGRVWNGGWEQSWKEVKIQIWFQVKSETIILLRDGIINQIYENISEQRFRWNKK
jgi:hypothetical protein